MAIHRSGDLARYATEQVISGQLIQLDHQMDGTGCCRCCGRGYPCDAVRDAAQLIAHYEPYLGGSNLIRPYVAGGHDLTRARPRPELTPGITSAIRRTRVAENGAL